MTTPNDFAPDDDVNALPPEAQALYHTLERDGANWQISAASEVERINQRLQTHMAHLHAEEGVGQPIALLTTIAAPASAPVNSRHRAPTVTPSARYARARRWGTTMVVGVIVLAFLAALGLNAAHRPTGAPSNQMVGVTPSRGPVNAGWVDLHHLDYATSFSANDPPAIAPSDPRVVYETMAQGLQQGLPASMRVTTDGGATWRTLATPVPASHIGYAGIGVSPLDPRTVFLRIIDTKAAECPANRLTPSEGGWEFCRLQYTSVDGGASWQVTGLPLAGGSKPGLLEASINDGASGPIQSATLRAQGQRLFAGYMCADFSCSRLVTSLDGGRNWSFADQGLLAAGAASVCDYTTSAVGATVYAVTSALACDFNAQAPLTLWRSSDAGVTWTRVQKLATPNERGIALTQDSTTGATLLYLAMPRTTSMNKDKMGDSYPIFSSSASDVLVSVNGGAVWQRAPTKGIPAGDAVFLQLGLLGTLADGSVVVDVIPPSTAQPGDQSNFNGSDLYAWKPGDAGWRKIASVSGEIDSLLVTPAQAGTGNTLYTIMVDRSGVQANTFTFLKMEHVR